MSDFEDFLTPKIPGEVAVAFLSVCLAPVSPAEKTAAPRWRKALNTGEASPLDLVASVNKAFKRTGKASESVDNFMHGMPWHTKRDVVQNQKATIRSAAGESLGRQNVVDMAVNQNAKRRPDPRLDKDWMHLEKAERAAAEASKTAAKKPNYSESVDREESALKALGYKNAPRDTARHNAFINHNADAVMRAHAAAARKGAIGDAPSSFPHVRSWDAHGVHFKDPGEFELPAEWKTASIALRYMNTMRKLADMAGGMPEAGGGAPEMSTQSQGASQELQPVNYLRAEQMGQEQQDQQAVNFYKGKQQEAQQAAQMAQQQLEQTQQQMQQIQQQADASQQQIEQALQQATAAQDDGLQKAQEAANMRIAMQKFRADLMNLASQDPAAATAQQMQGGAPPAQDQGQPPADAAMGTQGAAPSQQDVPQPGPPPAGGASPAGSQSGAMPASQAKTGGVRDLLRQAGTAAKAVGKASYDVGLKPTVEWARHNPWDAGAMAGGAVIGATVGSGASQGGVDALRQQVRDIEAQQTSSGGTFAQALNKLQLSVRAAHAQAALDHPVVGALSGAALGMATIGKVPGTVRHVGQGVGAVKGHVGRFVEQLKRMS
jgi:hypothetical protein